MKRWKEAIEEETILTLIKSSLLVWDIYVWLVIWNWWRGNDLGFSLSVMLGSFIVFISSLLFYIKNIEVWGR